MAAFDLSSLNLQQRQAVSQIEGPLLILAGAGTGKTRVVSSRIFHMLNQGIKPEQILAVTFTNKAANEMRERISDMAGKKKSKPLTVCTFHSLCVRVLREDIEALELGYRKNFAICTADDQVGLLKKLITKKAGKDEKLEANVALSAISGTKNKGVPIEGGEESLIGEVAKAYNNELRAMNAVDFDDLLVLASKVMSENPEVARRWGNRFRYVMVDEFQDTNRLQMELLRHLAASHHNVCVVGDDDQSIYGFRGAEVSNLLDFEQFFPNPMVVKLEENYRSTNTILNLANGVIKNNLVRREKSLWSQLGDGNVVKLLAMPEDKDESEYIANEIWRGHEERGVPWEDFAILFRTNGQSRPLEGQLREMDIPYRVVGGRSFFDRREVRDALAYLSVAADPDDDISLLRIINNPARGISPRTVALALDTARERGRSVFSTLCDEGFLSLVSGRAYGAIEAFRDFILTYHNHASAPGTDLAKVMKVMIEESGYDDALGRTCKTPEEASMRRENIYEVGLSLEAFQEAGGKGGLRGFLDKVALRDEKEEDIEKKQGVTLITLHASKGLEYPEVFMVGLEEGILPHRRSIDEGTVDEERRILYVGITRAQRELTITYCKCRRKWGELMPCMPSSFIKELNPDFIEEIDYAEEQQKPVEKEEAVSMFDQMRAMLEDDDDD